MNSAPTAALVQLLMPATNAAPLDDAMEREAKPIGANRTRLLRPSLQAAPR
jgi:hypothetical protein